MNIHPVFVHFPIALLTLYAGLEILSLFPKVRAKFWMEPTKALLAILGSIAAFLTLQTGEIAERLASGVDVEIRNVIETHSKLAENSTYIFAVLGLFYLLRVLSRQSWYEKLPSFIRTIFRVYLSLLDRQLLLSIIAVLGLIGILMTAALGGALVYGPYTDPFVQFVYGIFF